MTEKNEDKIFEELKDLVKKHNIQMLLPKAKNLNTSKENSLDLDSFPITISSNYRSVADNIIAISRNPNPNAPVSMHVQKNRSPCPISEFLKNRDKKGLKAYMNELDKRVLSKVDASLYPMKFQNNCIYILKNNLQEYLPIIESSKTFEQVIDKPEDFWMKIAFAVDNYDLLQEKVVIDNLLNKDNFMSLLLNKAPLKVANELLKIERFKNKIEQNFDLVSYVPIMIQSQQIKLLDLVLEHINVNTKDLDFDTCFQYFDKRNSLETEFNPEYFNEALTVFIIKSNYEFKDLDLESKTISEENKNLINKKILNQHLNDSLEPKASIKKLKI